MATEKRLIDANDVVKKLEYEIENLCPPVPTNPDVISATEAFIRRVLPKLLRNVIDWLQKQPTVDAVEVVHGRWHRKKSSHSQTGFVDKCSVCQCALVHLGQKTNYCPNCGAKMDGGS